MLPKAVVTPLSSEVRRRDTAQSRLLHYLWPWAPLLPKLSWKPLRCLQGHWTRRSRANWSAASGVPKGPDATLKGQVNLSFRWDVSPMTGRTNARSRTMRKRDQVGVYTYTLRPVLIIYKIFVVQPPLYVEFFRIFTKNLRKSRNIDKWTCYDWKHHPSYLL